MQRIPKFAFDYLQRGCNNDLNLSGNITDLPQVQWIPQYLKKIAGHDMSADLFGLNGEDAEKTIKLGIDGIIFSNHGGRQINAAPII